MNKTKIPPKCQICRKAEAIWAYQDVAGETSFTSLGSHYRGFKVTKVCDHCRAQILAQQS